MPSSSKRLCTSVTCQRGGSRSGWNLAASADLISRANVEEIQMAGDSGSSAVLGVIVGAVILAAVLFFVFGGFPTGGGGDGPDVNVEVPTPTPPAPGN